MQLGVVFPQTEIGADPGAIRYIVESAETLGYDHVVAYDHVLGADPAARPGWTRYTHRDSFHEPIVLFAFLASLVPRIRFATGILVLPQRQTALVAKQSAELDVLSGGRLRLGVGIGWNPVEYQALGMDFHSRGARISEQVEVLRLLWTQESVHFRGRWHRIEGAGINPLPIQRPIPLWMGGEADAVLRRIPFLADGWIPPPGPATPARREQLRRLRSYLHAAGRAEESLGIEARISVAQGTSDELRDMIQEWESLGATHLSVVTIGAGLRGPNEHVRALERFRALLSSRGHSTTAEDRR